MAEFYGYDMVKRGPHQARTAQNGENSSSVMCDTTLDGY